MEATISCEAFVSGLSVMEDDGEVLIFAHKGISIRLSAEDAAELANKLGFIVQNIWSPR